MSEDKIQSTKEAMYKFSKIMTLSDIEQTILRNGAKAIEQLQKENKNLKDKINNFNLEINKWLENSKAEMHEYGDNHEKYWEMFNQLLKKIKNKLVDISDYAVIDREREEELLNKEDILIEFEKWLEETINYLNLNKESYENYRVQILTYKYCLDKLQELKEGKK